MSTTTKSLTEAQLRDLATLERYADAATSADPDRMGVAGGPGRIPAGITRVHTSTAQSLVRLELADVTFYRSTGRSTGVTYYGITAAGRAALEAAR